MSLQDHTKLFELLPIRSATGIDITELYQLVLHHQQAIYFAVRAEAEVVQV